MLVTYVPVWLFPVLKKRKVEEHDDFILGPISSKEYKDMMVELNGSRTNRVFEFFKVTTPERMGFAKHREAAERKAAALALPAPTRPRLQRLHASTTHLRRGLRRKPLLPPTPQPLPKGRPEKMRRPTDKLAPGS
jgi:hypothetical protein